jgi:hypothetical protein
MRSAPVADFLIEAFATAIMVSRSRCASVSF